MEAASQIVYGIAPQTTFGTGALDSAAVTQIQCEPFELATPPNIRKDPSNTGMRYQASDDIEADLIGVETRFSTVVPIARRAHIDLFLAAWFQNVVEGATTPFFKEATLPIASASQQPDFSADAGYFFTWFKKFPTVSTSRKAIDCILENLTIQAAPGGMISLTADWVSRGAVDRTSNPSGTWTKDKTAGWPFASIARRTVNVNAAGDVTMKLKGAWELNFTQKVTALSPGDGTFESFALTERNMTFKIRTVKEAIAETCATGLEAGQELAINLGWGNAVPGTDNGDLDFSFTGKLTAPVAFDNADMVGAELSGEISSDPTTSPVTVGIANAIDRAW